MWIYISLKYKVQILLFPLLPTGEGGLSRGNLNCCFSLASSRDSRQERMKLDQIDAFCNLYNLAVVKTEKKPSNVTFMFFLNHVQKV